MGDAEAHFCQSCGTPMNPDDYPEGSEHGDFCHYYVVHGEFSLDRAQVKAKIADTIEEKTGKPRNEAVSLTEEKISGLKRWR